MCDAARRQNHRFLHRLRCRRFAFGAAIANRSFAIHINWVTLTPHTHQNPWANQYDWFVSRFSLCLSLSPFLSLFRCVSPRTAQRTLHNHTPNDSNGSNGSKSAYYHSAKMFKSVIDYKYFAYLHLRLVWLL